MAQEFSWSRLRHALEDVWGPTKGTKSVVLKLMGVLPFIGYGIFASLKPEMLLPSSFPGKIALAVLFLLLLGVPVRVAYRLRSELDDLKERILAVPESERNLIIKLKATAGRVVHNHISTIPFPTKDPTDIQKLQDVYSELRHHQGIYNIANNLATSLLFVSGQLTVQEFREASKMVEKIYQRLLEECDAVIKPTKDLAPSKASEY
jgi:hypothetical protein